MSFEFSYGISQELRLMENIAGGEDTRELATALSRRGAALRPLPSAGARRPPRPAPRLDVSPARRGTVPVHWPDTNHP